MDLLTDERADEAAPMACSGPVLIVLGIIASAFGLIFIGLPLIVLGGVFTFMGGVGVTQKVANSDAGKKAVAGARSMAGTVKLEADKTAIRSRAGKVIAQLHEQLQAGAISQTEYDQRVAQVNAKMNADVHALETKP